MNQLPLIDEVPPFEIPAPAENHPPIQTADDLVRLFRKSVSHAEWTINTDLIRDVLTKLTEDIEGILSQATPAAIAGAINWGDLGCHETYIKLTGDTLTICALIEEADPAAIALHQYVTAELEKLGYSDIEIETDW